MSPSWSAPAQSGREEQGGGGGCRPHPLSKRREIEGAGERLPPRFCLPTPQRGEERKKRKGTEDRAGVPFRANAVDGATTASAASPTPARRGRRNWRRDSSDMLDRAVCRPVIVAVSTVREDEGDGIPVDHRGGEFRNPARAHLVIFRALADGRGERQGYDGIVPGVGHGDLECHEPVGELVSGRPGRLGPLRVGKG